MRRKVLHMISTGSLAAFSSANLTGPGNMPGVNGSRVTSIRDARMAPSSRPSGSGSTQQAAPQASPQVNPGQILPRGSLLNLSV